MQDDNNAQPQQDAQKNKLFVRNISWDATDQDLENLFSQHGPLQPEEKDGEKVNNGAIIIKDRFSGRSKGFGFVTFENEEDAQKAVDALNGQDFMGRPIEVKVAEPRAPRPRRDNYRNNNY